MSRKKGRTLHFTKAAVKIAARFVQIDHTNHCLTVVQINRPCLDTSALIEIPARQLRRPLFWRNEPHLYRIS